MLTVQDMEPSIRCSQCRTWSPWIRSRGIAGEHSGWDTRAWEPSLVQHPFVLQHALRRKRSLRMRLQPWKHFKQRGCPWKIRRPASPPPGKSSQPPTLESSQPLSCGITYPTRAYPLCPIHTARHPIQTPCAPPVYPMRTLPYAHAI